MRNKFNFLEESVRVPMIMSFPGRMPTNRVVKAPVSHLDLHATILDYFGAEKYDNSDGTSLRRFIENKSYNKYYDERIVVSEVDERVPISGKAFDKELGTIPNFMIRKGNWKLMISKLRDSPVPDMMYNLG